nr:uncharacterized protein CI109_003890 [Kwoniella shandongensis]KAA5527631.1 hypothetical protein CI109_003890 [Kwoniella shandongensis]
MSGHEQRRRGRRESFTASSPTSPTYPPASSSSNPYASLGIYGQSSTHVGTYVDTGAPYGSMQPMSPAQYTGPLSNTGSDGGAYLYQRGRGTPEIETFCSPGLSVNTGSVGTAPAPQPVRVVQSGSGSRAYHVQDARAVPVDDYRSPTQPHNRQSHWSPSTATATTRDNFTSPSSPRSAGPSSRRRPSQSRAFEVDDNRVRRRSDAPAYDDRPASAAPASSPSDYPAYGGAGPYGTAESRPSSPIDLRSRHRRHSHHDYVHKAPDSDLQSPPFREDLRRTDVQPFVATKRSGRGKGPADKYPPNASKTKHGNDERGRSSRSSSRSRSKSFSVDRGNERSDRGSRDRSSSRARLSLVDYDAYDQEEIRSPFALTTRPNWPKDVEPGRRDSLKQPVSERVKDSMRTNVKTNEMRDWKLSGPGYKL